MNRRIEHMARAASRIRNSEIPSLTREDSLAALGLDSLDVRELEIDMGLLLDVELKPGACADLDKVGDWLDIFDGLLGPELPLDGGLLILTDEQFARRYRPVLLEDGSVRQWECTAEDWAVVCAADNERRAWTAVTGDDGSQVYIVDGARLVNRLYYVITEKPLEDGIDYVQVGFEEPLYVRLEVTWGVQQAGVADPPPVVWLDARDAGISGDDITEENSSELADWVADLYGCQVLSFDYRRVTEDEFFSEEEAKNEYQDQNR